MSFKSHRALDLLRDQYIREHECSRLIWGVTRKTHKYGKPNPQRQSVDRRFTENHIPEWASELFCVVFRKHTPCNLCNL